MLERSGKAGVYQQKGRFNAKAGGLEKFAYIISHEGGGINVDVGRIDETIPMELNPPRK